MLVNTVTGDEAAVGYFGYAYYQENLVTLTALPVKNSDGDFVAPDATTVRDAPYNPLSRPLFMNLLIDASTLKTPFRSCTSACHRDRPVQGW